jgi:hypothetical protein
LNTDHISWIHGYPMVPGHLHRPGGFVDLTGPLGLEPATDESLGDGCWGGMIPVGFSAPEVG